MIFLITGGVNCFISTLGGSCLGGAEGTARAAPNIIVIVADDPVQEACERALRGQDGFGHRAATGTGRR